MVEKRYHATEHVDDDIPGYALGALEAEERAQVDTHLSDCARCRRLADDYAKLRAALRAAPPPALPSPVVWQGISRRLHEVPGSGIAPVRPRRWAFIAAVASALAVAMAAGWVLAVVTRGETGSGVDDLIESSTRDLVFTLAPADPSSPARGRIFMSDDRHQGMVVVLGLPRAPGDGLYAVWLIRDDQTRLSAGTFAVGADGSAIARLSLPPVSYEDPSAATFVGLAISSVSSEVPGDPTGPDLLAGPLY